MTWSYALYTPRASGQVSFRIEGLRNREIVDLKNTCPYFRKAFSHLSRTECLSLWKQKKYQVVLLDE